MLSLCLTLSTWQWSPQRSFSSVHKAKHILYHSSENCDILSTASDSNFGMSGDEKAVQLLRVILKKKFLFPRAVWIEWSRTGVFEHTALAVFNRNPYINFWKSHYLGFPNVCKIRLSLELHLHIWGRARKEYERASRPCTRIFYLMLGKQCYFLLKFLFPD